MQDRPSPEPATTAPPSAKAVASLERLRTTIGHVFLGKPDAVDLAIVALLARGHVLLEDIPGVGKTTLAWVLAASVRGTFKRVQFTADLLPADVLGVLGVRNFREVTQTGVLPGIDVMWRAGRVGVAYDVHIAPRASPADARFIVHGVEDARLDDDGDLVLETPIGTLRHAAPLAFQTTDHGRAGVDVDFWIARWTPGAYHLADYGRHVGELTATDGDGRALEVERLSDSQWRIAAEGATDVVVRYPADA